uniref:Uncharacterized protein n=1 Tax=Triticum urartu TaxID=4572 RepID=A0A8R7V1E6_TRIUA
MMHYLSLIEYDYIPRGLVCIKSVAHFGDTPTILVVGILTVLFGPHSPNTLVIVSFLVFLLVSLPYTS